jgi:2-keto-4-pentenoate hydratase/2-oxohepta-3-ene-1,7-dioic acid hydratase in catechol pathway
LRLVTFEEPFYHNERLGLWLDGKGKNRVVDLNYAYAALLGREGLDYPTKLADALTPPDMLEFLRIWPRSLGAAREAERFVTKVGPERIQGARGERASFRQGEIKFKAPVPRPGKIIHTAGNFREHAREGKESGWEFPMPRWISFLKSPSAIIGHEDSVVRPSYTKQLDHEVELAIVIGKRCKRVTRRQAWDAIAGFTVFNDVTARDIQREEMKSGLLNFGKNLDTFALFGPCLVPKEDVGDVADLKIECRVNGRPRQVSNTSHLSVSIPQIVEHYSWVTLYPGDIITTGTVSGVAAFRKNPEKYFLRPGDVLESEVEGIGVLRNYIAQDMSD